MIKHNALNNRKILITRPEKQAKTFASQIIKFGGKPTIYPLLEIQKRTCDEELKNALSKIDEVEWLVFTSENGISAFFELLPTSASSLLKHKKFAVTGKKTEKVLLRFGYKADIIPSLFTAEHLAEELIANVNKESSILLICGNLAKPILKDELSGAGFSVSELIVYETVKRLQEKEDFLQYIQESPVDFITFTSGSAASTYLEFIKDEPSAITDVKTACIGPVTAREFHRHQITPTVVASEYTTEGLIQAIISYLEEEKK